MQNNNLNQLVPFSIRKRFPQIYFEEEQVYIDDWKQTVIDWAHDLYCNGWDKNKKHLFLYENSMKELELHQYFYALIRQIFGKIFCIDK
jgi:hypothetical protein